MKMIILVDIGNTNIVIGVAKENKIIETYRMSTDPSLTSDEYAGKLRGFGIDKIDVEGVAISSVVPQLDHVFIDLFEKYYNKKAMLIASGIKSGLKLKIDNQKQLGADLLCDCVGAYEKYPGDLLVVDLGTATKLLAVNKNKEYLGGAIAPGIISSLNSLVASAAKLSSINLAIPPKTIETETTRCIQSGAIVGHACMINGLLTKMKKELNSDQITVILTGGMSYLIKDLLEHDYKYEPNILLEGLLFIYNKNI